MKDGHLRILLAGNPNSGKTTIFNELSGMRAKVGNYAGVTVERKTGSFSAGGREIEVEDLPGVYTLSASSAEEKIAADAISAGDFDLIVNVVDSSNFERNLFLTMQLAEMKMPMIVALNMSDELEKEGKFIDTPALSAALGVPVIKTTGFDRRSIADLKNFIAKNALSCPSRALPVEVGGRQYPDAENRGNFARALRRPARAVQIVFRLDGGQVPRKGPVGHRFRARAGPAHIRSRKGARSRARSADGRDLRIARRRGQIQDYRQHLHAVPQNALPRAL